MKRTSDNVPDEETSQKVNHGETDNSRKSGVDPRSTTMMMMNTYLKVHCEPSHFRNLT